MKELYNEVGKLSEKDLEELLKLLEKKLEQDKSNSTLSEAFDNKYHDGLVCPDCGSIHVHRNGKRNDGIQQYRCPDCGKSFCSNTNTFLSNSKLSTTTWIKYIKCTFNDYTLRQCAKELNISLLTSFRMRHKIMNSIKNHLKDVSLEGIVENDEYSIPISYSGNHNLKQKDKVNLPRTAIKRSKVKEELDCADNILVSSGVDRNGNAFATVSCIGTTSITAEKVEEIYGPVISNANIVCTDGCSGYIKAMKNLKIEHKAFKSNSKEKRGIYHINNVNCLHSLFTKYFSKHHGISSVHINAYVGLIIFLKRKEMASSTYDAFIKLFEFNNTFRWKNYTHHGFITDPIMF